MHRLKAERRTEAGSYPVIFPSFGLPTAPQEGLPACGSPSKRGSENRPRTWPLRNLQTLQRGVLSGHPNWAAGSGTALGFSSAKQSISLLVYWNWNMGGKKQREEGRSPNFFKYWYAEGHFCVVCLGKQCPWVFCYGFYGCTSTL